MELKEKLNSQKPNNKEWFGEWFDSPYYHILYKHRDNEEAKNFIDNLIHYFQFTVDDVIQDLACGKGRHAIYLNKKGFNVAGLDLSVKNIHFAKKHQNKRLKFYVHDMRFPWRGEKFDYILNLFTSCGYFETKGENQQSFNSMARGLKNDGRVLIDFLNPYTVINNLVPEESKTINGIDFHIRKFIRGEYLVKDIRFEENGQKYNFQERVKAIRRVRFLEYFKNANLEVVDLFGDYDLKPYIAEKSERMIFVLRKKHGNSL
jgi:SAM-dependent methyltransferase